jgi:hypothetical protein
MATSNGLGSGREATRESQRRGRVSAPVMRERYPDLIRCRSTSISATAANSYHRRR